jgi:hypothetical protein
VLEASAVAQILRASRAVYWYLYPCANDVSFEMIATVTMHLGGSPRLAD